MNRRFWIALASAIGLSSFACGAVTMRLLDQHSILGGGAGAIAQAAQDQAWPLFGKPRSASAPRPAPPKPAGFAVWTQAVDTTGADPIDCVRLTRPLDPARSYGDFVTVTPALGHPAAVSVRGGDQLCLAGLGLADHHVTLLKGLPALAGETLGANADVDFAFGVKPPYAGFAGQGVILPRDESDGVGIETLNVRKLAVEVWRVPDRNLVRKQISAPDPSAEGDYDYDGGEDGAGDDGQRVWKGDVAVQGPEGQRITTVFPLGAVLKTMKPGAYVIKARDASSGRDLKLDGADGDPSSPAQARRWVMFTDMGLSAYDGSEALDVVVRSLKTARVIGGIKLALVARDGEDLASAVSDGSGRVHFARPLMKGEGGSSPRMVMAYGSMGDLAVLDLDRSPVDLSAQGAGGREGGPASDDLTGGRTAKTDVDAYLYADRGIYRPGETAHLVAMVRDRQARAVQERKGQLVVKRPSGVIYKTFAFDHAEAGAVSDDVTLPAGAPRGRWTAELRMEGIDDPVGQLSFSVEDFAPQRLAVTVSAQADAPMLAHETRKIAVSARFLYGAPGAGLQVQSEARLRADPDPFPQYKGYAWGDQQAVFDEKRVDLGTTVTDGAGAANLALAADQAGEAKQPLLAAVTASVFEPGGRPVRENAELKLRTQPVYFGIKVDQEDAAAGETAPVSLSLLAVDAQGRRVAAPGVTWTLISENWNYDWYQENGRWRWRRSSHDAVVDKQAVILGAGGLKFSRRLGWGDYRLQVETASGARSVVRFSAGWGAPAKAEDAPDVARVSAGTRSWAQGDTVEVAIKAPYGGEAQVAVATDRLIDFKAFTLAPGGGVVRLKTSEAWGGGAYVLVSVIQPRDPAVTPRPRRALGLVYVPLDPRGRKLTIDLGGADTLDSQATVDVPVTVHGLDFGERAHLTLAAVDEGVLRLTHQENPDPLKWYFGKRALTLDYRDDYGRLLDPNLGAPAAVNYGGDELGGESLTTTPIKTVALWSGVVETGADGKAHVRLPAADFNGQLRLMAVAWTDKAMGSAARDMIVRQPVVVDLDLPRFLAPGDRAWASLELHDIEGRAGGYLAQIFAHGGVGAGFQQLFQLATGQRLLIHAPLNAPTTAGISLVTLKVAGPGFATLKTYPIQTRLGWGPVTRTATELQQPGETFTPSAALMQGLAAGSVTLQVSYSPFKGFDPNAVALSLSRYPYGCTEQLVSTAYPLLYAAEISSDPRARHSTGALNDAVGKLLDRQALDGSFGLWRVGDGEADAWLGAYATDFLVEARAQGAPVPDDAYDRALAAMLQIARPEGFTQVGYRMDYPAFWFGSPDEAPKATARLRSRASAYALYVLAKAGRGDLARLRWWHDVQMKTESSPVAMAQIGAGLARMGDRTRAHDSFVQAVHALGGVHDPSDWYQSPLRDMAAVVTYAYDAGELGVGHELQDRLSGAMRDPDSLNTQEQARLLQAAHAMLAVAGPVQVKAMGAYPMAAAAAGAPRWSVGRLADAHFTNLGRGGI